MFRTERAKRPIAMTMAFLLCFTMMPTPAFATEANGENDIDASSTATPPTFDPSQTPTPTPTEDESSNESNETTDSASQGYQEEITIDDDSSDFIGEGETPDEPSSETVAKAAKLPAARAQINVAVPTVFNFGGDSGYNIDLGIPEEGYLSTTGMFLNKGNGIAQIASVKCSYPKDVPASEYALTNVEDKKIFGLIDCNVGSEIRFGVSEGVNEADTSSLKEGASYGMVSNIGNMFECRLYLDNVSFNANVADGLTLQPLANVVFTVQALSDNGTIDKDTPDSSLEDGSLPFYLKTFNTDGTVKAIYSAGEVKLHAMSIAVEGTNSPYYERYKAYIDADIAACIKEYDEHHGKVFFKDNDGNLIYKADGVTLEDDIDVVKQKYFMQAFATFTQYTNICHVLTSSNDTYLCKANINNQGYKRVRIIGLQSDSVASSDNKTGLTFETIDTFASRANSQDTSFGTSGQKNPFHVWNSPLFAQWNYSIGTEGDGDATSNAYYSTPTTIVDSWLNPEFPYVEQVTTQDGQPAYFFMLGASDIDITDDQSGRYYYYQKMQEHAKNIFVDNDQWVTYMFQPDGYQWVEYRSGGGQTNRPLASWLSRGYWDYINGATGEIHNKQPPYDVYNGSLGDWEFKQINYLLCFSF